MHKLIKSSKPSTGLWWLNVLLNIVSKVLNIGAFLNVAANQEQQANNNSTKTPKRHTRRISIMYADPVAITIIATFKRHSSVELKLVVEFCYMNFITVKVTFLT